jgi:sugar phosphate isomerase/epimerase
MKLSLCNEVLQPEDFKAQCALARALGYDGLEVAPFTLAETPHQLPPGERGELRRIAEEEGVPITGLHWLLLKPDGLSITAPEAALRTRTVEVMQRLIDLAHDLGAHILVHGSPKQRAIAPGESHETAIARAAECFAAIADHAAAAGVVYCIEPLAKAETEVLNRVEEAAAIVQAVGNPALRTMIDCCAAGQAEATPIPAVLDRWLPEGVIAHVHLNDPNRRGPGQGAMRFAPILAALRRNGYAGDAAIEPFIYEPDPPTAAARAIGYVQGILESLEEDS